MTLTLYDVQWHDAILLGVEIDRSNPGYRDVMEMEILCPLNGRLIVRFLRVMRMDCIMNFNVAGLESLRSLIVLDADPKIDAVLNAWKAISASLEGLKLYRIETNSTGSIIDIIARDFAIEHGSYQ